MPPAQRYKVSIVVITYQQVAYIRQCLDGILMQRTEWPIQILIGDDGSTDGTRELCMRYAQEHPDKVKLFLREQSDRNPAHPPGRDNLIGLLNAAEGEYIARCDGDDYWTDPEKLQRQVDHLEAHRDHAGCFNLVQAIDEPTGAVSWIHGDHGAKLLFTVEDTLSIRAICHPSGFIYRRSALPTLPSWFGLVISADMTMYSLVAGSGAFFCMRAVMGVYRKHDAGVTASLEHQGTSYYKRRIILWLHVDRHYGYRYTERCQQLFRHHWRHILRQNTPIPRAKHLWDIYRAVPSWFLAHPAFIPGRLKEIITGKARRMNDAFVLWPYIAIVTSSQKRWDDPILAALITGLREAELVLSDKELRTEQGTANPVLTSTSGYRWSNFLGQKVLGRSMDRMIHDRTGTLLRKRKIEIVLAEYGPACEAMLPICQQLGIPLVAYIDAEAGATRKDLEGVTAFIIRDRSGEQRMLAANSAQEKVFQVGNDLDVESEVAAVQGILEAVVERHRNP